MKKYLIVLLTTTFSCWAQQRKFVSTPTVAYSNEKASKAVGIFLRGAAIESYEIINGYIYKVQMDFSDPVFITDNYQLKDYLNTADDYKPSPSVIVEEDTYYGSPHLFTTVAGLKVREFPTGPSTIIGTLLNGSVVPLDYYPYNPDAWIPVIIGNKKGYIPMKFVGKRPVLEHLIADYKKATSPEDEKKYAERILELGWNSERAENISALYIFAAYAKKNNLTEIAEISTLQAQALSKVPLEENIPLLEKLISKRQFGFTLNNELEPLSGFKLPTLEKHLGKITKSFSNLEDCGLGDYETNVLFASAECIGHDLNKTFMLRNMAITGAAGFKIGSYFLNEQTTESEFLKAGIGLITSIDIQTNTYAIFHDSLAYEFFFRKGKLIKVAILYYC